MSELEERKVHSNVFFSFPHTINLNYARLTHSSSKAPLPSCSSFQKNLFLLDHSIIYCSLVACYAIARDPSITFVLPGLPWCARPLALDAPTNHPLAVESEAACPLFPPLPLCISQQRENKMMTSCLGLLLSINPKLLLLEFVQTNGCSVTGMNSSSSSSSGQHSFLHFLFTM